MLRVKDKKQEIDAQYGKYSVRELCDAFSLPTGTYYNHLLRNKNEKAWFIERRAMLSGKISEIFNNSRQTYGIKRIRHSLQKQGISISEKFVSELMREMGLCPIQASSKTNYKKAIEQQQKHLNPKEIEQIVKRYRAGESTYDLAKAFNCHRSTIANNLRKQGIQVSIEKINIEEAIKLYESGWTTKQLAAKYHMTDNAVSCRLRKAGVRMRTRWDY